MKLMEVKISHVNNNVKATIEKLVLKNLLHKCKKHNSLIP
jgi:hypothetical protein